MNRERFRNKEIDKAKRQILSELKKQFYIRKKQGTVFGKLFAKYRKTDAHRAEYTAACADSVTLKNLSDISSIEFETLYQAYFREVEVKNRKLNQIAETGSQILSYFQKYLDTYPYQETYKKVVDPYRIWEECKKQICQITSTEEELFEFFNVGWKLGDYYEADFIEGESEKEEERSHKESCRKILWESLLNFYEWDPTFDIFIEHFYHEI